MTEKLIRHLAAAARAEDPEHFPTHGFVIVVSDMVTRKPIVDGWVDQLDRPWTFRPGVVAVPDSGPLHVAAGGNSREGAREFRPLNL